MEPAPQFVRAFAAIDPARQRTLSTIEALHSAIRLEILQHLLRAGRQGLMRSEIGLIEGVHPNSLTKHLQVLHEAGLLQSEAATTPGRFGIPRVEDYRIWATMKPVRDLVQFFENAFWYEPDDSPGPQASRASSPPQGDA